MKLDKKIRIAVAALLICGILLYIEADQIQPYSSSTHATIQIEVTDGITREPLAGATVVIPETGGSYSTDEKGMTPSIQVPVLKDNRFTRTLPQDWGCFTVLVYKESYISYALFYTQARSNETRAPISIYLFLEDDPAGSEPFSIVEGPDTQWVKDLLEKYQPE